MREGGKEAGRKTGNEAGKEAGWRAAAGNTVYNYLMFVRQAQYHRVVFSF